MRPIETPSSNFTYKGSTPDVDDLRCRVEGDTTYSVWEPDAEELDLIANGADLVVELAISGHPIPPVSIIIKERER